MADETYMSDAPGIERVTDEPDAARAEIEMTRARMSETIDDIEEALLRKKAQIQDRMDVLAPIRERPIPSAAIALGAGLVLGLLTGGDDDGDREDHRGRASRHDFDDELSEAEERAATWEARARRLMDVARTQEEQLEALSYPRNGGYHDDEDYYDDEETEMSGLRERVADGVTGFLGTLARDVFAPRHR